MQGSRIAQPNLMIRHRACGQLSPTRAEGQQSTAKEQDSRRRPSAQQEAGRLPQPERAHREGIESRASSTCIMGTVLQTCPALPTAPWQTCLALPHPTEHSLTCVRRVPLRQDEVLEADGQHGLSAQPGVGDDVHVVLGARKGGGGAGAMQGGTGRSELDLWAPGGRS